MSQRYFSIISKAVLLGMLLLSCGGPQVDKKKSNTRTELAKDFLSRHETSAVRNEAQKAITHNPENAEAFVLLGLADMIDALNNFKLLEVDSCLTGIDAEAIREEMRELLSGADKQFAKAITLDPLYSEALANQANAVGLLGDYQRSISLNEQAIKVPHRLLNLGLTRANLGWAKFNAKDVVGAAKDLRQALQFNSKMCIAKYRMGRVYFEREEWNKAAEQFQSVVETKSCPIQEANLYYIQAMKQISMHSEIQDFDIEAAIESCKVMAPQSCIASQCQALL